MHTDGTSIVITLTAEQVEEIRRKARAPGTYYADIAQEYGIDVGHVKFIANPETNAENVRKWRNK